jgi:hypothetical protein
MATKSKNPAKKAKKRVQIRESESGTITVVGRAADPEFERNIVLSNEIIKISDYLYERKIKTSTVKDNVRKFLVQIGDIVAEAPQVFGDYSLHEIEISAELSLSGELKLWGVGGADVEGKAGLKFVIQKGKENQRDSQ